MPSVLMIAPLEGGSPNLQLGVDEYLVYETGSTIEVRVNDWVMQATDSLPDGYEEIIESIPLYDDAEPPNITGYRLHCLRTEVVNDVSGATETQSDNPLIDAPPTGVVVRVTGTTAMLNTLDTRLQALSALYGIVPGREIVEDG